MKLKPLITIVAAICMVTVAALWWTRPQEEERDSGDLTGRKLLSSDILLQAVRIELSDSVWDSLNVFEPSPVFLGTGSVCLKLILCPAMRWLPLDFD